MRYSESTLDSKLRPVTSIGRDPSTLGPSTSSSFSGPPILRVPAQLSLASMRTVFALRAHFLERPDVPDGTFLIARTRLPILGLND